MNKLLAIVTHQRTAIAAIAVAVLIPLSQGLETHHVDWEKVLGAVCSVLAGLARSLIPQGTGSTK